MKIFCFILIAGISLQTQRQLLTINEFSIDQLPFNDIAYEAQEYYDSEMEQTDGLLPYKFTNKDNEIIIEFDEEQKGFIQVEKLLVDIKWIVQIEFQILNKEYLYQQAYSVDSRVQNMESFQQGWKDLVQESVDFIIQKISEHTSTSESFFPENFEDNTLKQIVENFSSETFQEQKFNTETREIVDEETPSEINCQSKSNPSANFYMFVCHNKDFKIFEITFYKQNEDLVHIYTYTPHQDNEYYLQHERFKDEEQFKDILLTSLNAVEEAKTYTKLNFENFQEIVQAALEDQSIEMFQIEGVQEMKQICNFNVNPIAVAEQDFYQIEISNKEKIQNKNRKLKIDEKQKILRTEKFNKNQSQIKYFFTDKQRLLTEKDNVCPLDECNLYLGEIFMDSFHYYQIKIHCKQLTADHYLSFQDSNQLNDKIKFIISQITKNIHQWKVINTELKDVKKEYHRVNFYYSIAEKLLKEHGIKVSVKEQTDKVIFMNKEKTSNLFVIHLNKDEQDDDVKATIHFYYPPELRSSAHLRDELTISANLHMKQEIYMEDALDEYLDTIKKDDSKILI